MKTQIGSIVRPCNNFVAPKSIGFQKGQACSVGKACVVVSVYKNRFVSDHTLLGVVPLPINFGTSSNVQIQWVSSWILIEEQAKDTASMSWNAPHPIR